jgi:hypothetical protein
MGSAQFRRPLPVTTIARGQIDPLDGGTRSHVTISLDF